MSLRLVHLELPDDIEALIAFQTGNAFPYHVGRTPTREQVEQRIASGAFGDDEHDTWWLVDDELGRIGFIRFEDIRDDTPMFDLRLANQHRGKGLGTQALRAAADHVFTTMAVDRFEGCTRVDNLPMRRTFDKAGWVQEAHYRRAWPVLGAEPMDAVNYSILRTDWQNGTITPVDWQR